MNPVAIYKELPKTNCKKCGHSTCMAFSVAVAKGDEHYENCPFLEKAKIETLTQTIKKVDWRENLIKSLKEEIKAIDLKSIAPGIGAKTEEKGIKIFFLGRDFLVDLNLEISSEGSVTPWEKILLLLYIKMQGNVELAGKWVSFGELKGGYVKVEAIKKECEKPLTSLLKEQFTEVEQILKRLGAQDESGHISDRAWRLFILPKIPILIQYWASVEEFPPSVKILFDETAVSFLDIESLVFSGEGLVNKVEQLLKD
jgi:hypothetical protein